MADDLSLAALLAGPEQPLGLLGRLPSNPAHPPEWWNRGVRNVAGGIGSALANAFTFPGRYARGETGYTPGQMASEQPQATQWAAEMAMNMMGAPVLTGGLPGVGSGARRAGGGGTGSRLAQPPIGAQPSRELAPTEVFGEIGKGALPVSENITNQPDVVKSIVGRFGGGLASLSQSKISSSQYLKFDGIPTHLPKSARREFFSLFPEANGATADGRFSVRVSDHPAVSSHETSMFTLRTDKPIEPQIERLNQMLEFLKSRASGDRFDAGTLAPLAEQRQ